VSELRLPDPRYTQTQLMAYRLRRPQFTLPDGCYGYGALSSSLASSDYTWPTGVVWESGCWRRMPAFLRTGR